MGSWFFWCSEDDFVCFPSTARLPNCPEVYCGSAGYMAPEPCRWTNKIYTEQLERSLPRGGGGCTAIISILIFQDQLLWQNIHSNQLSSDIGHPIGLAAEIWCIVQIFLTVFWVEIPSPAPAGPLLWIKSLATSPAKSYEWSPANWADLFTISSFRFPTLKKRTFKKSGNAVIFDFSFFQRHRMNVRSGSCAPKESANDRPERVLTKNGLIF